MLGIVSVHRPTAVRRDGCTTGWAAPVADTAATGLMLIATGTVAGLEYQTSSPDNKPVAALGVATTLLAISAIYGFVEVNACHATLRTAPDCHRR